MVEKFREQGIGYRLQKIILACARGLLSPKTYHLKPSSGFTLIEMLVVVAIIVVVTSTVLANNAKFGGTILLQNLAYDIALSTREAQIYGVSVARFNASGTTVFTAPFGVHFERGANNKVYVIFADAVGTANGHYDTGELLTSTQITRGFYIADLCTTDSGTETCGRSSLDIVYKHPDPDAYICQGTDVCTGVSPLLHQRARIVVASPRGDTTNICADLNGQISVHNGPSCLY